MAWYAADFNISSQLIDPKRVVLLHQLNGQDHLLKVIRCLPRTSTARNVEHCLSPHSTDYPLSPHLHCISLMARLPSRVCIGMSGSQNVECRLFRPATESF